MRKTILSLLIKKKKKQYFELASLYKKISLSFSALCGTILVISNISVTIINILN